MSQTTATLTGETSWKEPVEDLEQLNQFVCERGKQIFFSLPFFDILQFRYEDSGFQIFFLFCAYTDAS
jgi:hypothetical protein